MTNLHVYPGYVSDHSAETRFMGRNLRLVRRSRGLTQVQLADLLGVTQPVISHWESGIDEVPSKYHGKMADIFANKKGRLDRIIKLSVANDPYLSVFSIIGKATRLLHLGDHACNFHKVDKSALLGRDVNQHCESSWQQQIFGERDIDDVVVCSYNRDMVPKPNDTTWPHSRAFVYDISLELDGYDKIVVNRAHFARPTCEPAMLEMFVAIPDLARS